MTEDNIQPQPDQPAQKDVKICPNCAMENSPHEVICVRCGELIEDVRVATRALDDTDYEEGVPRWGSARINKMMNLVLHVIDTEIRHVFDLSEVEQIVLGRKDPDTGESPEVDLTAARALEEGVSRQHASILRRDGALHIIDNNSANGTFLNGQRLIARQPRILRDGDDIRLGHLVLRVTFKSAQPNANPPEASA